MKHFHRWNSYFLLLLLLLLIVNLIFAGVAVDDALPSCHLSLLLYFEKSFFHQRHCVTAFCFQMRLLSYYLPQEGGWWHVAAACRARCNNLRKSSTSACYHLRKMQPSWQWTISQHCHQQHETDVDVPLCCYAGVEATWGWIKLSR